MMARVGGGVDQDVEGKFDVISVDTGEVVIIKALVVERQVNTQPWRRAGGGGRS